MAYSISLVDRTLICPILESAGLLSLYVRCTNKKSVNMGAHTDYECLTLLHTRNKGLQVLNKDDEWLDVPVRPEGLEDKNICDDS